MLQSERREHADGHGDADRGEISCNGKFHH
jgi:hypothetical protein